MNYTKLKLQQKTKEELIKIILKLIENNKIKIVTDQPPYTIADGTKGMTRGEVK